MKIKKVLLLFLFISSFSYAEYLLTINKSRSTIVKCITYYDFAGNDMYYTDAVNDRTKRISLSSIKSYSIKSGYYLDKRDYNACKLVTKKLSNFTLDNKASLNSYNLTYLGLSDEDLNLMFAISGLLSSFLFLFGLFRWI